MIGPHLCMYCGALKSASDFFRNEELITGYTADCKSCRQHRKRNSPPPPMVAEKIAAMRARKRLSDRDYRLRSEYGIDTSEWLRIFDAQGRVCAACGTDTPTSVGWAVDHCHQTGSVRAILCNRCNIAIGLMKEDASVARMLADYIDRVCAPLLRLA